MKFCGNCGKQIDDNANACPFCGTMQGGGAAGQFSQTMNQFGNQMSNQFNNLTAQVKQAKKSGGLTLSNIIMLAGFGITLVFSFFAFVKIKVEFLNMSESISLLGCGILGILGFLIIIAGLVLVIMDSFVKPMGMVPLILGAVQVVWMIIMAIYVSVSLGGEYAELLGDTVSKGIGFWFYIIGSIVVAAGTVIGFLGKRK
ncbi:MAG: zinc-ribbon domain-containing protein [Lachnospiraceae bacterium]|nr:zinc-ribbon domain-containing protein [Lachnospiraceae bacterium]